MTKQQQKRSKESPLLHAHQLTYLHIPKVLCRPLPNLSTSTNDSRSLSHAQQNTPPRHPQAFWIERNGEGKKTCREGKGRSVVFKKGWCLGRISSQTAQAKFAQAGKSKQCKKDRPYEQGYWKEGLLSTESDVATSSSSSLNWIKSAAR
jgi:hypothetical protein